MNTALLAELQPEESVAENKKYAANVFSTTRILMVSNIIIAGAN